MKGTQAGMGEITPEKMVKYNEAIKGGATVEQAYAAAKAVQMKPKKPKKAAPTAK